MGIIGWILFGALAGWLAGLLGGTNQKRGCIFNIVLGIVGAFVGGLIMEFLGGTGVTGFNLWSILVAVLGALIVTYVVRGLTKSK
jgi:uncharacterized membrane protein YeaQ/YmgE (transglycosylase-associated protein family)